jgi:membrane-bound serine protease (ClpP class)
VVTKRIISSKQFKKISLDGEALKPMDNRNRLLIGKFGIASTDLKPSGKVEIEGRVYDAIVSVGLIERGNEVEVVDVEFNQLVVKIKS